ncbi:MAG: YedE-related selenium metabolism membrane protein [Oscillospiraceae bacterium]|nr:YedE-related selenium metabolism membrane protein [Oscillospiraceae bacterium]
MKKINWPIVLAGGLVGLAAVVLTALGNPANMGFCIACFLRDIAGATKMHSAAVVQYFRPEIVGLVLGAFIMSVASKEYRAKAGSSPATRFVLGAFVMIGALAFLGCPLRMMLRLAGGDLNALIALFGFAAGIAVGVVCLNKGFSLKRAYDVGKAEGSVLLVVLTGLFILSLAVPALFAFSEKGPGSMRAPALVALLIAVVVGAAAYKTRLCMAGGIRDGIMFKDFRLLFGFVAVFAIALIGNIVLGKFKLGFAGQPVAHSDHVWSFLGMALVGWGSVLLGGCPLRQLILAGAGNGDSAVAVLGMIVGAAFSHNFGLAGAAASADAAGGVGPKGRVAIIIGFIVFAVISAMNIQKQED